MESKMERCANTAALSRHLAQQEEDDILYEAMLDELRDADEEDYETIISSHGWADADEADILKDI